jgi:hypothetical protein
MSLKDQTVAIPGGSSGVALVAAKATPVEGFKWLSPYEDGFFCQRRSGRGERALVGQGLSLTVRDVITQ